MMSSLLKYSHKQFGVFLLILCLGGFLAGCDAEEPCASQVANNILAGFFIPGEDGKLEPQVFYFDAIKAVGANTLFYSRRDAVSKEVRLPLNPNADTTTFVFYYEGMERDTLQLAYNRKSRMISPDCELAFTFTNISIVKEPFKGIEGVSVKLLSTELKEQELGADLQIVSRRQCEPQAVEDRTIRIGFFNLKNGERAPEDKIFDFVTPAGSDSIFYSNNEPASEFDLALNPATASVTYYFRSPGVQDDTLRINYGRFQPVVTSAFCFPDIVFGDITIGKNSFDSVRVVSDSLSLPDNDTEKVDIEIFNFVE